MAKGVRCWVTRGYARCADSDVVAVWGGNRRGPGKRPKLDRVAGRWCRGLGWDDAVFLFFRDAIKTLTGLRIRKGSIQLVEFPRARIVKEKK